MIYIASDHAGFALKQKIIKEYPGLEDLGPNNDMPVDYPDYAHKLCTKINSEDQGILICGSGIGVSIAANRYKHIRAALCTNEEMARVARNHNDANVVCLGARFLTEQQAFIILDAFFTSDFDGDIRHLRRIHKLGRD